MGHENDGLAGWITALPGIEEAIGIDHLELQVSVDEGESLLEIGMQIEKGLCSEGQRVVVGYGLESDCFAKVLYA
jgi:hypothetical protein